VTVICPEKKHLSIFSRFSQAHNNCTWKAQTPHLLNPPFLTDFQSKIVLGAGKSEDIFLNIFYDTFRVSIPVRT